MRVSARKSADTEVPHRWRRGIDRGPAPTLRIAPLSARQSAVIQPTCACGGGCPRCLNHAALQPKLAISTPGDPFELEADRIAEHVMRMSEPPAVSQTSGSGEVQRTPDASSPASSFPTAAGVARSGRAIEASARLFMESCFGRDFSHVCVHTDDAAAESAYSLGALAYTVGSDIVFGSGQYAPQTTEGRRLLAHELTHTVQQSEPDVVSPQIMRKWDGAADECSGAPKEKWIQKVVVNQEMPQTVTVHWSDGTTESDACSTGKGHCCVDPTKPDGVACTVEGSHVDGSNCTPITKAKGYPVQNRVVDHNGVALWTEFVPERAIALHQYAPVDGTPLSHGCVRLNETMARTIFCGVRRNQTYVQIQGFARPICNHPALQAEWLRDFAGGGADLSKADGDQQKAIRETRRELNAAFGRTLSVAEIQALTVKDIPHCTATAPLPPGTAGAQKPGGTESAISAAAPGSATSAASAPPPDLDFAAIADRIYQAIAGPGTDEETVYRALQKLQRNPKAIARLQVVYKQRHQVDLLEDIYDDFSGTELEFALQLLNRGSATSPQHIAAAPEESHEAARRIREAVEGWGTDEEAIFAVLAPFNRNTLAVQSAYYELYQEDLRDRLIDEMSGSELDYALELLAPSA